MQRSTVLMTSLGLLALAATALAQPAPAVRSITTEDLLFDDELGRSAVEAATPFGDILVNDINGPQTVLLNRTLFRQVPLQCRGGIKQVAGKDINKQGDVTGFCCQSRACDVLQGFVSKGNAVTMLQVGKADFTQAMSINDAGKVCGDYRDPSSGHIRGFCWRPNRYETLDVPGAEDTIITAITNKDDLAGFFLDATGVHGWRRMAGIFETLDAPGALETVILDMLEDGTAVGVYVDQAGQLGSFLYTHGEFRRLVLPLPSAVVTDVASIAPGIITGRFLSQDPASGNMLSHGFIVHGPWEGEPFTEESLPTEVVVGTRYLPKHNEASRMNAANGTPYLSKYDEASMVSAALSAQPRRASLLCGPQTPARLLGRYGDCQGR